MSICFNGVVYCGEGSASVNRVTGLFDCIEDFALSSVYPSADAGLLFDLSGGTLTIRHTAPPNDDTFLGGTQIGTNGTDTIMSAPGVQQFKVDGDGGAQLVWADLVDGVFQSATLPNATWVKNLDNTPTVAAANDEVTHNVVITIDYTDGEMEVIPVKLSTRYREPAGGGGN